jgi:hypothetical protein
MRATCLLATVAAVALAAGAASAATLVGLTGDNRLFSIDTEKRTAVAGKKIQSADKVLGIDQRPADGKLYGLTASGTLVIIDPKTGAATGAARLAEKFDFGPKPVVDFNPMADRLRVVFGTTNLRINVETGQVLTDKPLNWHAKEAQAGKPAQIAAGAYTNSVAGTKETDLYHLDIIAGGFVLQSPPNDGLLTVKGPLGLTPPASAVLDIQNLGEVNKNVGIMIADGTLYEVNIESGKATAKGPVKGLPKNLVDIAVWK